MSGIQGNHVNQNEINTKRDERYVVYSVNNTIKDDNYVKYMIDNYEKIKLAKKIVNDLDPEYIKHVEINKREVNNYTISIVMTTHNRPIQTYYTLKTITKSNYKNIHVIIVDDSNKDFINTVELEKYGIYIDYITISNSNKFWINPCINYNIGFKFVKGDKVIIQNSEVCHVGDVISRVNNDLKESKYLVFDVIEIKKESVNNIVYTATHIDREFIKNFNRFDANWLQYTGKTTRNFHFLSAINKVDLVQLNGFDYDFSMGYAFDDDEFIHRIKNTLKLNIINIAFDKTALCGIHLWHSRNYSTIISNVAKGINKFLLDKKNQYQTLYDKRIMLCDYDMPEYEENIKKL